MPEPCPTCGRALVSVAIQADERAVTMQSCTRCDRRWWVADGAVVDPAIVFAKPTS